MTGRAREEEDIINSIMKYALTVYIMYHKFLIINHYFS